LKPVIGITTDIKSIDLERCSIMLTYPDAISAAGGIPFLLPPVEQDEIPSLVDRIDGLLLIGGDDYDPAFYGQPVSPLTRIGVKRRQDFDRQIASYVLHQTSLPVLGICAGCQLSNIVSGGTLIQDVPTHAPDSRVQHGHDNGKFRKHDVNLDTNTKLFEIYGTSRISTPTWHHQAVMSVGTGLSVSARADDGIIEAVERAGTRFVIGVQWHPEQDLEQHLCLFKSFVLASSTSNAIAFDVPTAARETVVQIPWSVTGIVCDLPSND
jgi:putative glutamine amidotransferase